MILPQRFENITSIELSWDCSRQGHPHEPRGKQGYDDLWAFLASIPGLRTLQFAVINSGLWGVSLEEEEAFLDTWLGPLDRFAKDRLKVFDFAVPRWAYFSLRKRERGTYNMTGYFQDFGIIGCA